MAKRKTVRRSSKPKRKKGGLVIELHNYVTDYSKLPTMSKVRKPELIKTVNVLKLMEEKEARLSKVADLRNMIKEVAKASPQDKAVVSKVIHDISAPPTKHRRGEYAIPPPPQYYDAKKKKHYIGEFRNTYDKHLRSPLYSEAEKRKLRQAIFKEQQRELREERTQLKPLRTLEHIKKHGKYPKQSVYDFDEPEYMRKMFEEKSKKVHESAREKIAENKRLEKEAEHDRRSSNIKKYNERLKKEALKANEDKRFARMIANREAEIIDPEEEYKINKLREIRFNMRERKKREGQERKERLREQDLLNESRQEQLREAIAQEAERERKREEHIDRKYPPLPPSSPTGDGDKRRLTKREDEKLTQRLKDYNELLHIRKSRPRGFGLLGSKRGGLTRYGTKKMHDDLVRKGLLGMPRMMPKGGKRSKRGSALENIHGWQHEQFNDRALAEMMLKKKNLNKYRRSRWYD